MSKKVTPVVLCILDGWGHNPDTENNAIKLGNTPAWDDLEQNCISTLIRTDGPAVGLPEGQMGNSEVGHTNIGAGRIIYQDLLKITKAFEENEVGKSAIIQKAIKTLRENGKSMHIMGLASAGGVHSHLSHMLAAARIFAEHQVPVKLHLFSDGRDTPPTSISKDISIIRQLIREHPCISIATVCGRYYAMDRDNRWERVEKAYKAIVSAQAEHFDTAMEAIEAGIRSIESTGKIASDEFLPATTIGDYHGMEDGDGLFMINFRSDRAREILQALLEPQFDNFVREHAVDFSCKIGMVNYSKELDLLLDTLFPTTDIKNTLGEVLANHRLPQLHCAETEKYPHVTFFFNGGREKPYELEDRILIPSPKVATYDLQPEMSAPLLTDNLIRAIKEEKYCFIVVNYANGDMVGHSGILPASIKAVEAVDTCLARLKSACIQAGYTMLVTADHGNSESLWDRANGVPHTQHTTNPVRLIMFNPPAELASVTLKDDGKLADIAPTVLDIMNLEKPAEMTGKSLIKKS